MTKEPAKEELEAVVITIINYRLDEITKEYLHNGQVYRHVGWHNANGMAHDVIQALDTARAALKVTP